MSLCRDSEHDALLMGVGTVVFQIVRSMTM